jgi:hypothetical protein
MSLGNIIQQDLGMNTVMVGILLLTQNFDVKVKGDFPIETYKQTSYTCCREGN